MQQCTETKQGTFHLDCGVISSPSSAPRQSVCVTVPKRLTDYASCSTMYVGVLSVDLALAYSKIPRCLRQCTLQSMLASSMMSPYHDDISGGAKLIQSTFAPCHSELQTIFRRIVGYLLSSTLLYHMQRCMTFYTPPKA